MAYEDVIQRLIAERERLSQAIALLQGGAAPKQTRRKTEENVPDWVLPKPKRKARKFTKAQRAEQAERARKMWESRRKAGLIKPKKKAKKA